MNSKSPFVAGKSYRVLCDFRAFRDTFRCGEWLVFHSEAYSRNDGMTGYFFTQEGVEGFRTWDVADDEDVSVAKDLFEEHR
jgi:hypothetical protein